VALIDHVIIFVYLTELVTIGIYANHKQANDGLLHLRFDPLWHAPICQRPQTIRYCPA